MQAGGGFIKNKQRGALLLLTKIVSKLYALIFTSGKGRRRLPEFDISQPHFLQRQQSLDNALLSGTFHFREKFYRLIDCHIKHIEDIFPSIFNVEHFLLIPLPVTALTSQSDICHKLHLNCYRTIALTFLTSTAISVVREISGIKAHLFSRLLLGKETTYFIKSLKIGCSIAPRRLSDRILVDKIHAFNKL